jgi:hypothetical protein
MPELRVRQPKGLGSARETRTSRTIISMPHQNVYLPSPKRSINSRETFSSMPPRAAQSSPLAAVIEALLPPLVYSRDCHLIICQVCQHGLGSLPNIKRHLTRHITGTAHRKTFANQLQDRLETLGITNLEEVTVVPVLAPYTTHFADLRVI